MTMLDQDQARAILRRLDPKTDIFEMSPRVMREAVAECETALQEADALRKDAERYRWLRAGKARTTGLPRPGRIEIMQWEDRCREIARDAALACGEHHAYMPSDEYEAEKWEPHRWVVDAMLRAANEAEQERDAYRAGNTELLELLMKLHAGDHTAVLRRGQDILLGAGLLSAADNRLNWAALEARRPKRQTWEQAVRECVTDPAEVERLLALDDNAITEQVRAAGLGAA